VPTGDSQLDRANSINIDEIRDRRAGVMPPPPADRRGPAVAAPEDHRGPASGPSVAAAEPPPAQSAQPPQNGAPLGPDGNSTPDVPKKEDPVYKKWWFWAVVAVGVYVGYQLVQGSSSNNTAREMPLNGKTAMPQPNGLTLLRW